MSTEAVLLVDDDPAFRAVYATLLSQAGYRVLQAGDRSAARQALDLERPAVVLLDLMLPPDGSVEVGLSQLGELLASQPASKVIVVSGAGDVPHMLRAVRSGAYDFLTKPVDPDVLLIVVQRAVARYSLERQVEQLRVSLAQARPESSLLGTSPAFLPVLQVAQRVAQSDLPVLITGETGTGKELLARLIHDQSPRRHNPFIAVNCGAMPETLLESTLFGHARGAFTGANKERKGLLVEANGGTLFLDEIGDMPPPLQVSMLRALESGEVLPVGCDRPVRVNVRVVSATHRDIAALMKGGAFREDLYWRIRGAQVELPALRERISDVPLLARHFLNLCSSLASHGKAKQLSPAALAALQDHDWPGNLRELRHEMQRATVLAGDRDLLEPEDLSFTRRVKPAGLEPQGVTLQERVEAFERREIEAALARCQGNRTHAAQELGLSRQGLLNKMSRYGLTSTG